MNMFCVTQNICINEGSSLIDLYSKKYTLFGDLKIIDPLKKLEKPELILGCLFSLELKYVDNHWYLPAFYNKKYLDLQNITHPILKLKLYSHINILSKISISFKVSFEKIDDFVGVRYYFLEENVNYTGLNNNDCSIKFLTNKKCLGVVYYYGVVSYFMNEPNFEFCIKNEIDDISNEIRKIDIF